MEYLSQFYDLLPASNRLLSHPGNLVGQLTFSLKDVITILCATVSIPKARFGYTGSDGPSEVPYYGRSPPVYPSRMSSSVHGCTVYLPLD